MSSLRKIWFSRDGEIEGPVAELRLKVFLRRGLISVSDFYSLSPNGPWVSIADHPSLRSAKVAPVLPIVSQREKLFGKALGLKGKVSISDVRRAYREKICSYHPDKVSHLGEKLRKIAEEETKLLNEAFDFFQEKYGVPRR